MVRLPPSLSKRSRSLRSDWHRTARRTPVSRRPASPAAVEQVDALDVAAAHLRGRAEGGVAVRKGDHGGEDIVLGEGQPARGKSSNAWGRTQNLAEKGGASPPADRPVVVHDRVVVVRRSLVQGFGFVEVESLACSRWSDDTARVSFPPDSSINTTTVGRRRPTYHDVLNQNLDVAVPVGAAVLVLEAEDVEQLVLHCALIDAALTAERHHLDAAQSAHEGVAAATRNGKKKTNLKTCEVLFTSDGILDDIFFSRYLAANYLVLLAYFFD